VSSESDDPKQTADPRLIRALLGNFREESEGAATYHAFAEREPDPHRRAILREMAVEEEEHARRWSERLQELGASAPVYTGSASGSAGSLASRVGGSDIALRRVELDERQAIARYGRQLRELDDEPSRRILEDLIPEEQEHSRRLRELTSPLEEPRPPRRLVGMPGADSRGPLSRQTRDPEALLDAIRKRGGRRTPASWIGDAIYGVNDGLGAIFGIVSGVSGATLGNSHFVLIAGLAGMVASALSMGSGAYLAAKSEREIYEAELQRKRDQVEQDPEQACQELALVYEVKGLPQDQARLLADQLALRPEQFLRTLAAEELNLTEDALSNPLVSAASGALSTALGAFFPIIPFFFLAGVPAVIVAAIVSLAAHFAVGAAKSLITVRSWWSSGAEMTVVGALEGVVTYAIGIALGHLGNG
jgi:VIT1/CCC1 family predicted Fe2+/Mn2+ transporter/rubrerythrin